MQLHHVYYQAPRIIQKIHISNHCKIHIKKSTVVFLPPKKKKSIIRKEKHSCITCFFLVLLALFKWLNLCYCACADKKYSKKDTECNQLFILLIMLLCTPSPQANKTDLWKCLKNNLYAVCTLTGFLFLWVWWFLFDIHTSKFKTQNVVDSSNY